LVGDVGEGNPFAAVGMIDVGEHRVKAKDKRQKAKGKRQKAKGARANC
jgi:hypothetical protein